MWIVDESGPNRLGDDHYEILAQKLKVADKWITKFRKITRRCDAEQSECRFHHGNRLWCTYFTRTLTPTAGASFVHRTHLTRRLV